MVTKTCPHCNHEVKPEELKTIPEEEFEAVMTVQVTFERRLSVYATDREKAQKLLKDKAVEDMAAALEGDGIRDWDWMDTEVETPPLEDVGVRKWSAEEDQQLRLAPSNLDLKEVAELIQKVRDQTCTPGDVEQRRQMLRIGRKS